jgi:RNase P subunit RPR2
MGEKEGYCLKCRSTRQIKNAELQTLKNGRRAVQGTCPQCGTKMYRMVAATAQG